MKVICHARFPNQWYASPLNLTNLYFVNVLRKFSIISWKHYIANVLWDSHKFVPYFQVSSLVSQNADHSSVLSTNFSTHYWNFSKWIDDWMLIIACDHIYVCQLMLCDLLLLMAFALLHFCSTNTNIDLHLPPLKWWCTLFLEITMLIQCHLGNIQWMNQPLKISKIYKWIMNVKFLLFQQWYIYNLFCKERLFGK